MPDTYWIKLCNPDGTNPRLIASNPGGADPTKAAYTALVFTNLINGYGTLRFTLPGVHAALSGLVPMSQVEVWRAWPEQQITATAPVWSGFYLDEDSSITEQTGDITTLICYSDVYLLSTCAIAWYAGYTNRSLFSSAPGETIMKTLVNYNGGPLALAANGRDRDHVISGLAVDADGGGGNSVDWACAGENLLTNLAKLAPVAGGDFDLIKAPSRDTWTFRWYTGQRGTDRSLSVKFSVERGNMRNPRYIVTRVNEKTVAIVKGQNSGPARAVAIRTGNNYNAATNNNEFVVNASSQATTTATLNAAGDAALEAAQAPETIQFDALPFGGAIYGRDWFLGDRVAAKYKAHSLTPRAVMVTTTVDPQVGVTITPRMATNV